jgi:hypothetical protein
MSCLISSDFLRHPSVSSSLHAVSFLAALPYPAGVGDHFF